jgi:hypothetical protein
MIGGVAMRGEDFSWSGACERDKKEKGQGTSSSETN